VTAAGREESGIHDVIVVGAGVAGLTLARALRSRGWNVLVLERARGVGGRCATRRVEGQPVDHGLAFLHGRDPRFLDELDDLRDVAPIPDWPRVREGEGVPCQPSAFDGAGRRLALAGGVSGLAKHLARGLDVRLEANVEGLRLTADPGRPAAPTWELRLASGETLRAKALALAMPAPSADVLLRTMEPLPPAVAALLPVLDLVRMLPCLAVIARYPAGTPVPRWEVSLPGGSAAIQTILHDSSKRPAPARPTLVVQARPAFSRARLDEPRESWSRALLEEAAVLHGDWIARPELAQAHAWSKARVAAGSELAGPLAVRLDGGAMLGVAGDGFHVAGGLEGAYLSGLALAARLSAAEPAGS
jgi:renalase